MDSQTNLKRNSEALPQVLEVAEVDRLFVAARKHSRYPLRDVAMLRLMYGHGLRVLELVNLNRADIRWDEGEIVVRRVKNRRRKDGSYPAAIVDRQPLSKMEKKTLRAYQKSRMDTNPSLFIGERGDHLTTQAVYRIVTRLGLLANLGEIHPHTLRHSCGFKLINEGVPERVIQSWLGHRTGAMTRHYTQLSSRKYEGISGHFA